MRPLVLLWGCLVLPGYGAITGPKKIRGFEGDTVSLQCTYEEKLKGYRKYWCRKSKLLISRCSGTIYAGEDGQERTEGRVSIQDSPWKRTLTVTLRKLTLQDSGEYWCAASRLGFDEVFLVSLIVLPGPCCPPSPTPFFQPLATSLQPKAKAWQTQPPELTSPGVHSTVTTAKQGKTEAWASPSARTSPRTSPYKHAGTSLYTGTSPHAVTSPRAGTPLNEDTSLHKATSPHAGTARPSTNLGSPSAKDTSRVLRSSSSKPRVFPTMLRILAPVLVLLTLLLATGLAAIGRYMLQWRKEVQLATETQKNQKVNLSQVPLGNGPDPEYTMINLAAPTGPLASPKPSASPASDTQCRSQTAEEQEAPVQDLESEASLGPPLYTPEEEFSSSIFIPV